MAEKGDIKTKITEYFGKSPVRFGSDKQAKKIKLESVNGTKETTNGKGEDLGNVLEEVMDTVNEECDKSISNDVEANEQIVDEDETSEMHFPCSNCDFITGDENEIIMHMEECNELEDLNTQSFKTDELTENDADLDQTGDNDELSELQYPCSNCDYFSSDLNEIASHMATCSGQNDQNDQNEIPIDTNESKENVNDTNKPTKTNDEKIELHFTCSNCDFIGTSEDEVLSHMKSCTDDYDLKTQPYYTVYKHDLVRKTYKFIYSSQDQETNKKAIADKVVQKKVAGKANSKQQLKKIRILYENSSGKMKRNRVHTAKGNSYSQMMKKHKGEENSESTEKLKKKFMCDICEFVTDNKFYIEQHVTVVHSDEKPIQCKECGYRCKRRGDLTSHMLVHQEKVRNCICNICGWSTYKSSKLKVHMRIHTGEKPYKCDVCDYASYKSDALASHMKIHSLERPFKCDVCGKAFKQSHNLNSHKLIHTGNQQKNHLCTVCDYAAITPHILKCHMLIHTNERPYECPKCDYRCKMKSNLTVHMLKHTNKKPYVCFECGFSTKLPQTLKRHERIHSREHCAKPDSVELIEHEKEEKVADENDKIYVKCEF